jgi:hypothetical protein
MLDGNTRGILEKLIDEAVIKLPALLFVARANKSAWHIQNETDYVIGVAHGKIMTAFLSDFVYRYSREPSLDEMTEASNVVFKRSAELKKAAFESG